MSKASASREEEGGQESLAPVLTLPKRRRRGLRAWITAAVALVVVGGILAVLYLTPLLPVRSVAVNGTRLADAAKVQSLLQPLVGTPLAKVSSDAVRERLAGEAAISDIRLGLSGPGDLSVTVLEHREVAVLKVGEGYQLVGDNGAKLKALAKRSDRKLPLVSIETADPDRRIFDTVVHALAQLPASVLKQLDSAQAGSVDSVTFTLTDKRKVVWGDASEGQLKASVLAAMLKDNTIKDKTLDVSTPRTPLSK